MVIYGQWMYKVYAYKNELVSIKVVVGIKNKGEWGRKWLGVEAL